MKLQNVRNEIKQRVTVKTSGLALSPWTVIFSLMILTKEINVINVLRLFCNW